MRTEESEATEDEMVGHRYQLNGLNLVTFPGTVKDREAWCASVHLVTKSGMTEQLNNYSVVSE